MVAISYRTAGVWGAGIGMNLTDVQFDTNNYNLSQAIQALIANPTLPNNIANITVTGNKMSITLQDTTVFGPFTLPIAQFHDRGVWAPAVNYVYGDIFTNTVGLYMVLQDHTSAGVFNPAAANGFGPLYRKLFDASGLTMTFRDGGYPILGATLNAFDVFAVDDLGVYLVLITHAAAATFVPTAVHPISGLPLYKKIFAPIQTAVARLQFQYPGGLPLDTALMWKFVQDDPRNLVIAPNFAGCSAHIEVATTVDLSFQFKYAGVVVGTLTFVVGNDLDGAGGQFGAFSGIGATIPHAGLLRMYGPGANGGATYLNVAIVGSYTGP